MVDMSVRIGSVTLPNPVLPASGTFSTELSQVIDLNRLGGLVTKTVSRNYRAGNPPPRVSEIEAGMINSIGLPTKGLQYFLDVQVAEYRRFTPPLRERRSFGRRESMRFGRKAFGRRRGSSTLLMLAVLYEMKGAGLHSLVSAV